MLMEEDGIVELLVANDEEKTWRKAPVNCVDWRDEVKRPFESCGLCWEFAAIETEDKEQGDIKSLTKKEVAKMMIEKQGEISLYVSNTKERWNKNKVKISSIDFEKNVDMPFWNGVEKRYKYVGTRNY
jgi:hypothetical protein